MRILAVDTSGWGLSLAIGKDPHNCVSSRRASRKSDEILLPQLHSLLRRAGTDLAGIDALAAGCGPGRFTGIRIAMTFVEMLARSLGKPFVAVNHFEAWCALQPRAQAGDRTCLVLPAGRDDVYFQLARRDALGRFVPEGKPGFAAAGDAENVLAEISRRNKALITRYPGELPASGMLAAARNKLGGSRKTPYRPLYLRLAGYEMIRGR